MDGHMTLPPGAPTSARPSLALTCLLLALVLPLGLLLLVLRYVVALRPALQPLPPALSLILEGGANMVVLLGTPTSGLAIGLGHFAVGRAGQASSGRTARRVARTGLALGYLSLGAALAGACFTAFWLGGHRMHLVW